MTHRVESSRDRLLIVGGSGGTNVGSSLFRAAGKLGLDVRLEDAARASRAPWPVARFNWWMRGHRPSRLVSFGREVVATCRAFRPHWLVATGFAPLDRSTLAAIRELGTHTISFLTDDPWNPSSRSDWFFKALPVFDRVFSARRANLADLERHGCRHVSYLPFGVDTDLFFPEALTPAEALQYRADVFFAGGADRDRVPYIRALIDDGMSVALYGDYWGRFKETRDVARGRASVETQRKYIRAAAVCLCLVRRLNRDGHSMRTFEVPAAGGCMLVEDTEEHRDMFGADGEAVVYFRSIHEMVAGARRLLANPEARSQMAAAAHRLVMGSGSTYLDRLQTMLWGRTIDTGSQAVGA